MRATGSSASESALSANVAASTANTTPGDHSATISPDSDGPKTAVPLCESESSAFACWSRGALTVCGTSPVDAGPKNACAAPNSPPVT